MSEDQIGDQHKATFDGLRQLDVDGHEFWFARELAPALEYRQWRNFLAVLERAKEACRQSGQSVENHFAEHRKMVDLGSNAYREIGDLRLSRYACYLIVQNESVKSASLARHRAKSKDSEFSSRSKTPYEYRSLRSGGAWIGRAWV